MDKRIYIFEDFDCLCDIVKDRENDEFSCVTIIAGWRVIVK